MNIHKTNIQGEILYTQIKENVVWGLLCVMELKTFPTLLFSIFSIFKYLFHPKLNKVFKFLILVEIVRFAIYSHVPKENQPLNIKTIIKMTSHKLLRNNHKQIHESLTHPRNFHIPFMMLFFFFSPKLKSNSKLFQTLSHQQKYLLRIIIY
jgi:hypothetical protein